MHSVVLTKGIPDFRERVVAFDEESHLERGKPPTVMNPDEFALRAALGTRVRHGGTVSALSMGPPGSAVYTRWEQNLSDVSWYHSS